jgi:hypothetical protein
VNRAADLLAAAVKAQNLGDHHVEQRQTGVLYIAAWALVVNGEIRAIAQSHAGVVHTSHQFARAQPLGIQLLNEIALVGRPGL